MYGYSKRPSKLKRFFLMFFSLLFVAVSSVFLYSMYLKTEVKQYLPNDSTNATRLYKEEALDVYSSNSLEESTKSVVAISKIKNKGALALEINGPKELGLGSGVIISQNGYIITNWHVAGEKYSNCYVTLENGEIYNGSVLWADSDLDLAMVKINALGLKYLNLGNSDELKLGEDVWAIGNPVGTEFQRTVTKGIISGLDRTIKIENETEKSYMEDLIQTDASINNGNSGGALINKQGELIGINTVKIESAEGIGFAVPINIIKPVINNFIEKGNFEEAYLGIFAYDKEAIRYIDSNVNFNEGIYVIQISADGPAKKSGLKVGDIITRIDDLTINKMSDLRKYIYNKNPEDTVKLSINRKGKIYSIQVKLSKR